MRYLTPTPKRLAHPEWVQIYRSVDWGFYPDPSVCLWFCVFGKRVLVFKEKQWIRTIAKDVARDIVKESVGMRVSATYCDPTMGVQTGADIHTVKDTFELNGVPLEASVNNREFFANAIHSALGEEISPGIPRLQFLKSGCPRLIKFLPVMTYNDHDPHKMADHRHDHLPVALAYFLQSFIPMTAPAKSSAKPWWWSEYGPKSTHRVLGSESVRKK